MSNFTNSTTNRGVEAKEIEIANARLDMEASYSAPAAGDAAGEPERSYLQVLVEKHRRKRLPTASSPTYRAFYVEAETAGDECGDGDAQVRTRADLARPGEPRGGRPGSSERVLQALRGATPGDDANAEEPECVEVYRFERVGAWLACGGARPTRVERRVARGGRIARAAAAELGAAVRLAVGAPLHAALLALRCALQLTRDAAAGTALAVSDYAFKPTLALAFNAVLHPALVFLGNVLRGARAALRPACGALGECAAAAAVLLRAARLVEVHYHAPAACACASRDAAAAP